MEYNDSSINFEDFLGVFLSISKREEHPKNIQLLQAGRTCRKLYFIEKGILRFYYYNDAGKDITHWFRFENSFITELDSFLNKTESSYYIETLEETVVYSISLEGFYKLSSLFPETEKIWNLALVQFLLELGEKVKDLQFRDAPTRYSNLIEKHPDILQRVALGHIASYLGITQQSLSRIRKQK
ncbi:MAG: Crp/Fnr family transcriptional regulator [Aureispira sp.]|nr:Crp/Fnr family transcriptional regulator [Aureispira sp.]